MNTDAASLESLIARARFLGRELANETQPESYCAPIRRELAQVNEKIDAIRNTK